MTAPDGQSEEVAEPAISDGSGSVPPGQSGEAAEAAIPDSAGGAPSARRRRSRRRRLAIAAGATLGVLAVAALLLAWRYVPYVLDARDARSGAQQLASEMGTMQLQDVNATKLGQLRTQMNDLHGRVDRLRDLLGSDPLVGFARTLSVTHDELLQADSLMSAAEDFVQAGGIGLDLGDRFVALRQQGAGTANHSMLGGVVELMATSTAQIGEIHDLLAAAHQSLAAIPPDAAGEIRHVADLMAAPIGKYTPLLDQYISVEGVLPEILGWGTEKRYLVLAEDPAELRPSGGYAGTVGIVAFQNGQLIEHTFQDVYTLDLKKGVPYVQPPEGLQNHLLGDASWQLADANWSPDFPTAAQDALRLYTLESGDSHVDGVIALTTFAVDRLLNVIGPVQVHDYNVTVHPGEVTLTALGLTRGVSTPTSERKQFLNSLANTVLDRLLALPPSQWLSVFQAFQDIENQRLMLAWFKDPGAASLIADNPLAGAVRQDPGDYLYVVEANVAPTSKYNLVVHRRDSLSVVVQPNGDAEDTLRLDWQNDAQMPGEPFTSIRSYSTSHDGYYGTYLRALTVSNSELVGASGQTDQAISGVETVAPEAGRNAFANYLLIPPGSANLTYEWHAPGVATRTGNAWSYALTVQKEPGIGPQQVNVQVTLPAGAVVTSPPDGATVNGTVVTFTTPLTADAHLVVDYRLP